MSDSDETKRPTGLSARLLFVALFWVNAVFWVGYFTWAWLAN